MLTSCAAFFTAILGAAAVADDVPIGADLWQVELGTPVTEIAGHFVDFACGTDGGPPSLPIAGFAGYAACPTDGDGLHEVYFRYDEEREYRALALDRPAEAAQYGTTAFGFPVVVSLLIDEAGTVRGKRLVSDPRPEHATRRPRHEFWTLGNLLLDHFGSGAWTCADLPLGRGEQPADGLLVKRRCEIMGDDGRHYIVEQSFLQKAGQGFIDPHTGALLPGDFESQTRFEVLDAA